MINIAIPIRCECIIYSVLGEFEHTEDLLHQVALDGQKESSPRGSTTPDSRSQLGGRGERPGARGPLLRPPVACC